MTCGVRKNVYTHLRHNPRAVPRHSLQSKWVQPLGVHQRVNTSTVWGMQDAGLMQRRKSLYLRHRILCMQQRGNIRPMVELQGR
jgi:hypothetical protein